MVVDAIEGSSDVLQAGPLARPLLIHYQLPYLTTLGDAWFYVLPLLLMGFGALYLSYRNHPVGFLATAAFAVLVPTSVVPILMETAAERRMYLPLVAIMVLVVVGAFWLADPLIRQGEPRPPNPPAICFVNIHNCCCRRCVIRHVCIRLQP